MTKLDIIKSILNYDFVSIQDRLNKLEKEDKITAGAAFWVYSPYEFYSYKTISELISKAAASKDYTRYLKRISSTQYQVWWQMFQEDGAKTKAFIEEQESLPFNQTQKQLLIQAGEI